MDIRKDGFYGQVVLPEGNPVAHRGSIMHIVSESLKDVSTARASRSKDGSEILIRIRDQPFDTDKESLMQMNKALELGDMLDATGVDDSTPIPGERYDEYVTRLGTLDYPRATILMLAAEWFQMPKDSQAEGWLSDEKAIRFRELNTRHEAFESALPSEYDSLKAYVIGVYPDFTRGMIFRTA